MDCKTTSRANGHTGGFTLVEVLLASGIAVIVMTGVFSVFLFISRFSVPMLRNVELDRQVQNAVGWVARELREATNVVQFSTNAVTVSTPSLGSVTYQWAQNTKTVQRVWNGTAKTLLTECDSFNLTMLKASPIDGELALDTTTNLAECKALAISSQCSRASYSGSAVRLSSASSATVVMRVKGIHN